MMGYYMELMKGLEEADKVHCTVGVVEHGSITSYLQIGTGYDYFCEQTKARDIVYSHKYPGRLLQATFMQKKIDFSTKQ